MSAKNIDFKIQRTCVRASRAQRNAAENGETERNTATVRTARLLTLETVKYSPNLLQRSATQNHGRKASSGDRSLQRGTCRSRHAGTGEDDRPWDGGRVSDSVVSTRRVRQTETGGLSILLKLWEANRFSFAPTTKHERLLMDAP
jgi:hypothetical protein